MTDFSWVLTEQSFINDGFISAFAKYPVSPSLIPLAGMELELLTLRQL